MLTPRLTTAPYNHVRLAGYTIKVGVYSAGVTLWVMLTGQPPFADETNNVLMITKIRSGTKRKQTNSKRGKRDMVQNGAWCRTGHGAERDTVQNGTRCRTGHGAERDGPAQGPAPPSPFFLLPFVQLASPSSFLPFVLSTFSRPFFWVCL